MSKHFPPHPYSDAAAAPIYVTVTRCKSCGTIGRDVDCPRFSPCRSCGGEVRTHDRAARYVHKPTGRRILFGLIRETEGEWEFANPN